MTVFNAHDNFRILVFRITLFACAILFSLEYLRCYSVFGASVILFMHCFMIVVSLGSLLAQYVFKSYQVNSMIFALCWMITFVIMWLSFGGIDGPLTYFFFTLLIVFTLILHRRFRLPYIAVFTLVCMALSHWYPYGHGQMSQPMLDDGYPYLSLYYIINSILIAITVIFLKSKLDIERRNENLVTQRLTNLNSQLETKRVILLNQQRELASMQENLESMVFERTNELFEHNEKMSQYAYSNAHLIRGPLCNIKGVLAIIEQENVLPNNKKELKSLALNADKLDDLLGEINLLLK
ncbi:hypothetical protein SAMN04488029_0552 [Reichenbachiella faecimaris]|uniref:Signal transduction histidine kinase dimerisation/phosphoacceptor domain-containing protein n=1 Tax=Reichenbachiella faecimaris TaxID=692418 RepID=A0A1W2G6A4_REIFA|nr:hypothetical protein [Reichenbachiella faecimaris]SMD32210.1 hypothetical protein SAMN04488029_0552 [Reichenbachiella faecimaris]